MPTAAEREAFMQMMGISAADVAEPDTKPKTTGSRFDSGAHPPAARPHGAKPHYPSYTESVSSSVGLSTSSVNSSAPTQQASRQLADKRRLFLAELGITDASLEATRGGAGSASSATHLGQHTTAGDRADRLSNSEPGSTLSGDSARPLPSGSGTSLSAEDYKIAGNNAFEQGQFTKAVRYYTSAIDVLHAQASAPARRTMDGFLDGETSPAGSHTVQLAALYSNRSAAYLQGAKQCGGATEDALEHALYDAEQAVMLRGDWFKGYSRQGDVYFKMQRYEQAADAFQMALHLEPGNHNILSALEESRERARLQYRRGRGVKPDQSDRHQGDGVPLGNTAPTVPSSELYQSSQAGPSGVGTPHRAADAMREQTSHGGSPSSARMAYGLYDHGLPKTGTPQPTSATYSSGTDRGSARRGSFDAYYGSSHGDVRQEWDRLKHEVENTTHDATGDEYRRRELEKFRLQRSSTRRNSGRSFASLRATFQSNPLVAGNASQHAGGSERRDSLSSAPMARSEGEAPRRTPHFASNSRAAEPRRASVDSNGERHLDTIDIPAQFSSEAAATYQQKLLEEYRRRKEKKG